MPAPTTSLLVHFDPAAGGGSPPAEPGMTIALVTELRGVRTRTTGRPGLFAELSIAFGDEAGLLPCARAVFDSPVLTGHPDFAVIEAGYGASDCYYAGPDEANPPWVIYRDREDGEDDPVLAIGFADPDLYNFFSWSAGFNAHYDPPLEPDEDEPELEMLVGTVDVQLPMRLYIGDAGGVANHQVKELIYLDAPRLSGSGQPIGCDADPVFAVTASELLEVTGDIADGDYELYWRIYKGSGDITYLLQCDPSPVLGDETIAGEYTDTRNGDGYIYGGGLGTDETQDLLVARLRVERKPLPFLMDLGLVGQRNIGLELDVPEPPSYVLAIRDTPQLDAGDRVWHGESLQGHPVALTWRALGTTLYAGGRPFYTAPGPLLAAALRTVLEDPEDPESDEILELLMLCSAGATYEVYRCQLRADLLGDELLATLSRPVDTVGGINRFPLDNSHQFSPDTSQLLCYRPLWLSGSTYSQGAIWSVDWSAATVYTAATLPAQGTVTIDHSEETTPGTWQRIGDPEEFCSYTQKVDVTVTSANDAGSQNGVASACWSSAGAVVQRMLEIAGGRTSTTTETNTEISHEAVLTQKLKEWDSAVTLTAALKENGATVESVTVVDTTDVGTYRRESYGCWEECDGIIGIPDPRPDPLRCTINTYTQTKTGAEIAYRVAADTPRPDHLISARAAIRDFSTGLTTGEATLWIDGVQRLTLDHAASLHINDTVTEQGLRVHLNEIANDTSKCRVLSQPWGEQALSHLAVEEAGIWRSGSGLWDGAETTDYPLPSLDDADIDHLGAMTPHTCLVPIDPALLGASDEAAERPSSAALIAAHNTYRAGLGLSTLSQSAALMRAAAGHCAWMAETGTVSHTGAGGSTSYDRAIAEGYPGGSTVGENLLAGATSVADAMEGWHNSPGHESNIVYAAWEDIGVAIAERDSGGYYWCVVFGDPA